MIDAIELLNEVAGFSGSACDSAVRDYWRRGYEVVRQAAGDNVVVVIGDAFEGVDVGAFASEVPSTFNKFDAFTCVTVELAGLLS
jgi:hypothetical protein